MINHARTLLANASVSQMTDELGEYIDPAFSPIPMSGYAATVRRALFGTDPDAVMLAYRLRQFMAILHKSEFADHLTVADPRVTYFPFQPWPASTWEPRLDGGPLVDSLCYFSHVSTAIDGTGRCRYSVRLNKSGSNLSMTYANTTTVESLSFTDGLSSSVLLPGGVATLRVANSFPSGDHFLTWITRPSWSLGQIVANITGADELAWLFEGDAYTTYRNLWRSQSDTVPQLIGAILALIKRTEDSRGRAS
jgi:hypothetical protein